MKKPAVLVILLAIHFPSSPSWGWGKAGHQTIEVAAISLLPQSPLAHLLRNNVASVKYLSMVPDFDWKHGNVPHPLEGQAHFFDVDYYGAGGQPITRDFRLLLSRFGRDDVLKQGTGPWRMRQMANLLVIAMKRPHPSALEIITLAATMGHYTGDLGNPLHNCSDFDGIQIGVPGLHYFFESATVESLDQQRLLTDVRQVAQETLKSIPDNILPIEAAMKLSAMANASSKTLLAEAHQLGLTPQLQTKIKPMILQTMSNSTAALTKIWNMAWILAGKPSLPTDNIGSVPTPPWIPLDYIH